MKKVTNLSKATELVKSSIDARMPKSYILAKAAAKTSEFFAKTAAKKSITELTATKRKSKVAEIDAVIDGLRKTNATVSPFAALGV